MLPPLLIAAVDELYAVFARYPRPVASSYSRHTTITPEDVAEMRAKPLRELEGRALSKFSMKALTTWGDENEFRHYLPRMLELVVTSPAWTDVPTLFGKLSTASWREWPIKEQRVIERFVYASWESILRGSTSCLSMARLAQAASNAGIEFRPLAEMWSSLSGAEPLVQLSYLIGLEEQELLATGRLGRHWSDDARRVLGELIRSEGLRQRLELCFFELTDTMKAHTVSEALSVLDNMPEPSGPDR